MDVVDMPATRSGNRRSIKNVDLFSLDMLGTRAKDYISGDEVDMTSLFYLLNFDDDEGSAILGADDRLDAVIAITYQGSGRTATTDTIIRH